MTAQVHENLILNGKMTSMNFCPPILNSPEIITELSQDEFYKGIEEGKIDDITSSTACWRGYIGTWEIKDGKFFLNDVTGCIRLAKKEPIWATWFTGVLRIPQVEELHYVHMGFGSLYEKELHIKIEEGVVKKQRTISNIEKVKKLTPEDIHMEGFNNLPGMENHFDGDDL